MRAFLAHSLGSSKAGVGNAGFSKGLPAASHHRAEMAGESGHTSIHGLRSADAARLRFS